MGIQVNQDLCAGCGACVDACSVEAIHIVDQLAVIDDALCTRCETCIEVCPNAAITARPIQEPSVSIVKLPAPEPRPIPIRDPARLPETETPVRGLATLAGTALAFLGREAAPRLVDVLINALERKLAQPKMTAISALPISSRGLTTQSRGKQRQARYRGGRTGNKNHKERR